MRKMVLFGSILALSACEATAEGGAEEATAPSEEVANNDGQTTTRSSPAPQNTQEDSNSTPSIVSWVGKSVVDNVNGSSIFEAGDLKGAILEVGGQSLLNQLSGILNNLDTEMGAGSVSRSDIPAYDVSTIILSGCGYRQCGSTYDQFLIEYVPEWGGVWVCVTENGKTNTYSPLGKNYERASECSYEMFYYE